MSDESYRAEYRFTRQVLLHSMALHYRLNTSIWLRIFLTLLAVVLLSGSFISYLERDYSEIFFLVPVGLILLFRNWINHLYYGYGFQKRKDADALVRWEFSRGGYASDVEDHSSLQAAWGSLTRVLEAEDGLLLYPLTNLFYWIPYTAFIDPEAAGKVKGFIEESGVTFIRKR